MNSLGSFDFLFWAIFLNETKLPVNGCIRLRTKNITTASLSHTLEVLHL